MKVLMKARAKFYAVWDDAQYAWTFQKDGANNYYRYPLNSFEYGSKIVEYFKLEKQARMYKADGMRDTGAEVLVSIHKDNAEEGEHIFEKYTGTDSEVIIWVDHFDNEDRGVEEGDYIEVDVLGFEDAVTLAIMNMASNTPPTPTPTVNFQIIEIGDRNLFDSYTPQSGEDYPEEMTLYPLGIEDLEGNGEDIYIMFHEDAWYPDYLLADVYSRDTVNTIWEEWAQQDPDNTYAWVAIDPPANSGNSGSDDEDEEGDEE